MPSRRISLFLLLALLVANLGGPSTAAPTKSARLSSAPGKHRWSDPATWGGSVPGPGARVTISSGSKVVVDTDTASLAGVQVDGTLSFARKNVELSSDWIMVHGTFRIGTPKKPFLQEAVVTLTGNEPAQDVMDMGTKVLGVMGGKLELHGRAVVPWTRLAATAEPDDRAIKLAGDVRWEPGDRIVIASTDYWRTHDEERTITSVDGDRIQLDDPLDFQHWGEVQTLHGHTVDERAEVGLLTRNITVRGSDATAKGFGGHMMIMAGGRARIDGVEFSKMGQRKALRRYPVHFHMDGAAPDSYLTRSAIHHSFNRCVTIHGTHDLLVKDNVCYDHEGHGFFFEDGVETGNRLIGNLGLGTREVEDGLLPTDERPATFWITNPDNVVEGNVAGGSDGTGFWYALPQHPTGLSAGNDVWPRRTPLGSFAGNVAHSNGDDGLNVDDGPRPNGRTESTWYEPVQDPSDPKSDPVVARFEDLTAYMNRDHGVWLRGEDHVVSGAVLADNRAGATFASSDTYLEDSLVVGKTANLGTPESWEDSGPDGAALPFFWDADTPIVGFEFYDGKVGVRDTTFVGFRDNSLRESGALAYLAPDAFSVDPNNYSERVEFVDADPVYLADPEAGMDGDLSKVFIDRDGSVTGAAGSAVVVDNPFLLTPGCSFRKVWNAHVCPAGFVSLWVHTDGGADPIKPLTLTRGDGATQRLMGCCDDSDTAVTSIIPERNYAVDFATAFPGDATFVLWRGEGTWLRLTLDVPSRPEVTRWGYDIPSAADLSALGGRANSAYFYDPVAKKLHLKLAAQGEWDEIRVRI
ncbi:MAG: G8 domain-containing protein [Actinomycetota bacterium]